MAKSAFIYLLFVSLLLVLDCKYVYAQKDAATYKLGQTHFRTLCSSCHSAHQEIYGPMLGSISKKRKESWLIPFIRNSQAVIKSGDAYAELLFEKFDHQIMPPFTKLSDADIKAILYYLEYESIAPDEYFDDIDVSTSTDSSVISGKMEFLEHCSMCHFIHKESYFAPALGSVTKRHSREWLVSFIQDSQKKIQGNDSYAKHLYNQFDQHVMTSMDFIPVEEINAILNYIEFASTINPAYKGKINTLQYNQQAITQLTEISGTYSIISVICLMLLILTLFLMLILFVVLYSFIKKIFIAHTH